MPVLNNPCSTNLDIANDQHAESAANEHDAYRYQPDGLRCSHRQQRRVVLVFPSVRRYSTPRAPVVALRETPIGDLAIGFFV